MSTVSPAGVKVVGAITSAPDDHLTPSPHCRVSNSAGRRIDSASGCPGVGARIVSPAGIKIR
jgi:hypothetical protein